MSDVMVESTLGDDQKNTSDALVIGIDTGGTYTDGVLLDYRSRQVLASHKALTTRRDLAIGIGEVIAGIPFDDPGQIKLVSISTTLATNTIAEGKGKPVALFLLGYDEDLVTSFQFDKQFATPHFFFINGGHDLQGSPQCDLDVATLTERVRAIGHEVDAIAVSGYFSPLNPSHELAAFEAIAEVCDLPVVLGHQLSTRLGSVKRATTAALNASLLAVLQDFVQAVRRALAKRDINAPLMVMRGDGTLMSADVAAKSPVETIHSGPAASAIGGRFLSRRDDALVVDIGGTTTDIALVQNGQVEVSKAGATVDGYQTAVTAANLLSIALGGDSHLHVDRQFKMTIGPERVTPLAYLAQQDPGVAQQINSLAKQNWAEITPDDLEYWYLLREPANPAAIKGRHAHQLLDVLRQYGPQSLPRILERLKLLHISQLDAGNLIRRELVAKAGLTPTDVLHVDGRFTLWDAAASRAALSVYHRFVAPDMAAMQAAVWRQMTEKMMQVIVALLTGRALRPESTPDVDLGRWYFFNSLHHDHPQLETNVRLKLPIIGIGAPASVTLPAIADALHTELVLPDFHEVANAVGAVAGSVVATEELLVYPKLTGKKMKVVGFYVQTPESRRFFEDCDGALAFARSLATERVEAAIRASGALNPEMVIDEIEDGMDTYRIRARAVGAPRLAAQESR